MLVSLSCLSYEAQAGRRCMSQPVRGWLNGVAFHRAWSHLVTHTQRIQNRRNECVSVVFTKTKFHRQDLRLLANALRWWPDKLPWPMCPYEKTRLFRPLDDASLGRCVPWKKRPGLHRLLFVTSQLVFVRLGGLWPPNPTQTDST